MLLKDLCKQIDNLGTFYGLVSVYSSVLEWCSANCSHANMRQIAGSEETVYRISSALIFLFFFF